MSVSYLPRKVILYGDIMAGKVPGISVEKIEDPPQSLDEACLLTDGSNYLCARMATNGGTTFAVYGRNDEREIINAIESYFGTELVSEHDDEFHNLVESRYRSDFVTIELPEGYLGTCARCLKRDAEYTVVEKLSSPITTGVESGLPPVSEIRIHVCSECLRDTDKKE